MGVGDTACVGVGLADCVGVGVAEEPLKFILGLPLLVSVIAKESVVS